MTVPLTTSALPGRLAVIDVGGVRAAAFVAFRNGITDWLMAQVSPGSQAPYWHVAVTEPRTGTVAYTRRAVDRSAIVDQLSQFRVTNALFNEVVGHESDLNPYDPGQPKKDAPPDRRDVYFIQAATRGGPIKIGVAASPERRLADIQRMSPVLLDLIGEIPGVGQAEETRLHALFAAHRLHGEWFRPVPELLAYISEHTEP